MSISTEEGYVHSVEFKKIKSGETVMNAWVAFNRSRYDKEAKEYVDTGTIWADLSLWGKRAEILQDLLVQGASIMTTGKFYQRKWKHKESGDDVYRMGFRAEQVAILGRCIKEVIFKQKTEQHDQSSDEFDDDIPF